MSREAHKIITPDELDEILNKQIEVIRERLQSKPRIVNLLCDIYSQQIVEFRENHIKKT